MTDLKTNNDENQPKPTDQPIEEKTLQPEELPPDIESVAPEDIPSPKGPPQDDIPFVYEESKKKYLIIFISILFFCFLFFLIYKIFLGKKPLKKVKLTYWGLWEDKEIFDPLIAKYKQQNPNITIDYVKMSPENYRDKLLVRSKKNNGPDIFRFHNTWLNEIKNITAPLPKNILSDQEFKKIFYPVHQKDLRIDKYYFGIPLEIDGLVLIYNESLFKKAGIKIQPTNWEEVINDIATLTVKDKNGDIITSGMAIGTASNISHFSDLFGLMLLQNGGNLKNLSQSEGVQILEQYRQFAEPPNNFWDEKMPNSISAFIQEKTAMIIAPSWETLVIKTANPDLQIKVVPVPQVPGGTPVSLANYWIEGVSKFSKNQIEAWRFLRFLMEKENLTTLYEQEAKTRLFGEPYSRVDLSSKLIQNEYIGPVIKQADIYVSIPLISNTYDNGLNDQIIQYLENAVNATIEGVSYEKALQTAQEGILQIYDKYSIE